MTHRRGLLLVILVYVSLDLALPAMPGAFVFEPADSVESAGGGRQAPRVVVAPTAPTGTVAATAPTDRDLRRRAWRREVTPVGWLLPAHRPRAGNEAPPPSEDPHRAFRLR